MVNEQLVALQARLASPEDPLDIPVVALPETKVRGDEIVDHLRRAVACGVNHSD
jgi:hypothetical protein